MVLLCYDLLCSESPSFPSSYTMLDNSDWVVGYLHSLPPDLFSLSFSLTNFYVNSIEKQFQLGKSARDGQSIRQCVWLHFPPRHWLDLLSLWGLPVLQPNAVRLRQTTCLAIKPLTLFFFLMNTVTKKINKTVTYNVSPSTKVLYVKQYKWTVVCTIKASGHL